MVKLLCSTTAPLKLRLVGGQARKRVCGNLCGQQQAHFREKCYHFLQCWQSLIFAIFAVMTYFFFSWVMDFQKILQELVTNRSKACSLPFYSSFIGLWVKLRYRNKSACPKSSPLCNTADLNQWPVQEKVVCSDSNQTAQLLQTAALKAWRLSLEWFCIDCNQKIESRPVSNEKNCPKAM